MLTAEIGVESQNNAEISEHNSEDVVVSLRGLKTYFPGPHLGVWPWSGRTTVKAVDGVSLDIRAGRRWGWWVNRAVARPPSGVRSCSWCGQPAAKSISSGRTCAN